jgi:two-component system cell cycle response regulator
MVERVSVGRLPRQKARARVENGTSSSSGVEANTVSPPAGTDRPVRVLVIDDDPELRETLLEALRGLGYDSAAVGDGPSGLDEFRHKPADLVLLDLNLHELHGMEGLEVCSELKKLTNGWLPVMFMTGMPDAKIRVLEAGGDDFLAKPFSLDALGAQVRLLLRTVRREEGLKSETRRFREIALVDELTGLGNRRAFDRDLARSWASVVRTGRSLAVIMVDVDNFKAFNDRHGHTTGDEVLKAVGAALSRTVRETDSVCRYGGEEFVIFVSEATPDGAVLAAERARRAVAEVAVESVSGERLSVTVSLGVACVPSPSLETPKALLEAADGALYRAKLQGKNCVVASG